MKVYEFLYCGCIFESSYATVSIHKTKQGAYKAMRDTIKFVLTINNVKIIIKIKRVFK